uniref:Uncharacterized protein n=1 Tax=Helianthus annuus TaxID=4232 RepID=A0A251U901_HELAN
MNGFQLTLNFTTGDTHGERKRICEIRNLSSSSISSHRSILTFFSTVEPVS